MPVRLQDWLLDEQVLAEATIQKAADRQAVYGGSLDTAILELGAMTEAAVWTGLSAATGLPAPDPRLFDGGQTDNPPALAAERTRPLRAVPVRTSAGILKMLCADPVAVDEIGAALAERGLTAELYVVPEVRLLAARHRVYGEALPARYAPLWARIRGDRRARLTPGSRRPRLLPEHAQAAVATDPVPAGQSATPVDPAPAPTRPARSAAPARQKPSRGAPIAPPTDQAALTDQAAPTPLEYLMELWQSPSGDEPFGAEVEVGAHPTVPMADRSSGLVRLPEPPMASPAEGVPVLREPQPPFSPHPADRGDGPPDPGGDTATEALCRRAHDPGDRGRLLALRALRRRLTHPAVQQLLADLRQTATSGSVGDSGDSRAAIQAIEALEELRDDAMIPVLIERLNRATTEDVAEAARRALVSLSAQDFGRSRRRWLIWLRANGIRPRVQWLLDGLDHKHADIRHAAAEELRQLSGESFGYVFDSPRHEREAARRRWLAWWRTRTQEPGQADPADPSRPAPDPSLSAD